jgi:uncharacterized coiled-coil protein SlyX
MSLQLAELFKNLENELVSNLKVSIKKYEEVVFKNIENSLNKITELESTINNQVKIMSEMKEKIEKTNMDEQNYQNFSLVSNLSKQITEKELEIKKYQAQLRIASKTIKDLRDKSGQVFEEPEDLGTSTPNSVISMNMETNSDNVKNKLEDVKNKLETVKNKIDNIKNKPTKTEEKPELTKVEKEEPESEKEEPESEKEEPESEKEEPESEKEESESEKEEPESAEEEEIEINFVKVSIKKVDYFLSDETPQLIYECFDNEPGEVAIGEKQGRKYVFYNNSK